MTCNHYLEPTALVCLIYDTKKRRQNLYSFFVGEENLFPNSRKTTSTIQHLALPLTIQ